MAYAESQWDADVLLVAKDCLEGVVCGLTCTLHSYLLMIPCCLQFDCYYIAPAALNEVAVPTTSAVTSGMLAYPPPKIYY